MTYGWGYAVLHWMIALVGKTLLPCGRVEFDQLLHSINFNNKKRILDFGCNVGFFTNRISRAFPDSEVHGVDINTHAIRIAQSRYGHISFHEMNDELFKQEYFDVIVVSHVLEHVKERELLLADIAKYLARDGTLIVAVPQERIRGESTLFLLLYNVLRFRFENPHVVKLTFGDLSSLLQRSGFKINNYTYINWFTPIKSKSLKFYSWSLIMTASKSDLTNDMIT